LRSNLIQYSTRKKKTDNLVQEKSLPKFNYNFIQKSASLISVNKNWQYIHFDKVKGCECSVCGSYVKDAYLYIFTFMDDKDNELRFALCPYCWIDYLL